MTPATWAAVASRSVSPASGSVVRTERRRSWRRDHARRRSGRRRPAASSTGRSPGVRFWRARLISPSLRWLRWLPARRTGYRWPPNVGPGRHVWGVHDLGAAGDRRQRQSIGDAFGRADQVRFQTVGAPVLAGEHAWYGQSRFCTSSAMNTTWFLRHQSRQVGTLGRNDEFLALDRFG